MNRLHQGGRGSLGGSVAASVKVYPRPLRDLTLATSAADRDAAWAEARRALALRLRPVALELTGDLRLTARLHGTETGVARIRRELGWEEADPGFWEAHARRAAPVWARISVAPERLQAVTATLAPGGEWWASPGVGSLHWTGALTPEALAAAREQAERAGGSLVLMAAPAALKQRLDAWGRPPDTLAVMGRIRDAFDPARTLSPGRYVV